MPCDTLKNNKTLKPTVGCLLCSFALVFVFSITAFAFTQMQDDKASALRFADEAENEVHAEVVEIIVNEGGSQYAGLGAVKKFPQTNDTEKLLTTTIRQQQQHQHQHQNKREVGTNEDKQTDNNHTTINRGYYEEQRPVVVHAESLPTLGRRQDNFGAPPTNFQDPYYERPAAEYEADELEGASDDGGGEVGVDRRPYEQQHYYDDGDEDESAAGDNEYVPSEQQSASEGRAAQNSAYDSYYRQWHYATPAPVAMQRPNGGWEVGDNRKLQNGVRDPYAAYDTDGPLDDYEYPGAPTALQKQQYQQQLQQQEKQPQSRPQQTTTQQQQQAVQGADTQNRPSVDTSTAPTENTLLSTLKSLKIMWDIYQAFAAAWNVLATHRQKQEQQQQEAAKRRQQQIAAQQMRINSKKPPKFEAKDKFAQRNSSSNSNSNKNADNGGGALVKGAGAATTAAKLVRPNNKATKNPKTTTTTKSTTTTELAVVMSSEVEEPVASSSSSSSSSSSGGAGKKKVGTKGDAVARQNAQGKREKRQMSEASDATKSTDVGEGRYIKGDPLKGYYDFVITEGSYKFWAVFQTGTALLIIYSTFAAIYYSKVNPLVSDYDYTDYLGGARSLSGGDDDFIDDDSASNSNGMRRGGWFDGMLPRAGRTLKYIFDALDKLPVDHREEDEVMKGEHLTTAVSAQPEQQPWALKVGGVANESDDTTVTVEADANEEENEGRKRN